MILSMHKKAIVLIIALTIISFANCLGNGFVGDDEVKIINNDFYKSWTNLPQLFSRRYITNGDEYFFTYSQRYFSSGEVSYRPVASLEYFLDYGLFGLKPFGYHLHSLLLHLLTSILAYFFLMALLQERKVALLAALIFCSHPIQSESVCAISFRHGILAALFFFGSFLWYFQYEKATGFRRRIFYGLSLAAYFLGLFSKEAVLVLPLLLMTYDFYFRRENIKTILAHLASRYAGFILISAFYLYVYIKVFPNSALGFPLMGGTLLSHAVGILRIFGNYVAGIVLPIVVNIVPPLYAPFVFPLWGWQTWAGVLLLAGCLFMSVWTFKRQRETSFFMAWFLISFLPVSNIIPLANPMANRFMYLPSLGLIVILAIALVKISSATHRFNRHARLGRILEFTFLATCVLMTISINGFLKSNYATGEIIKKKYPNIPSGYVFVGDVYFKLQMFPEAKKEFLTALALDKKSGTLHYLVGACSLANPDEARQYFQKAIEFEPQYALPYIGLGRLALLEGNPTGALVYLKKGLALGSVYSGFAYLIQCNFLLGQESQAAEVLKEAREKITDLSQLRSLENFFKLRDKIKLPIDVGI